MYRAGLSLKQISAQVRKPKTTVRNAIRRAGIELRMAPSPPGNNRRKAKGVRIGIPPFGFSWLRGRLVMNAEEIETLRLIIKLWQEGMTYTSIASHLNGHGIKTRKRSRWDHSLIRRVVLRYNQNPKQIEEILKWESNG
ncbi:MAG: hypothetical protein A2428_13065 [Bdellovibrionales bacterium RIFOXYC1_FULL_54_43]|nr:MAG: hypothetical protein A2428_13065 [Bdellovibrionales bacterium RIFOXYC1_FULL_54_43]